MIAIIRNILAYPAALGYVLKHGLYKYFFISGFISLVLGAIAFSAVYFASDDLGGLLAGLYPWESGASIVAGASTWLGGAAISILALILYKYLLLMLIGPFMGPLSERVEEIETGLPPKKQGLGQVGYQVIRGLRITVRNITKELFYTLLLLLLGLIPVLSPITGLLILAVQAYYIGYANTDYHLEKSLTVSQSISYCKAHRWSVIGNGAGFMLVLLLPVLGLVLAPVLGSVVATREALR